MNSLLALFDSMHEPNRYAELLSDFAKGPPQVPQSQALSNVRVGQFRQRVLASFRCAAAISVLAPTILRARNPFQIVRRIIQPVSIKMVDCGVHVWNPMEGLCDQAMSKIRRALPHAFNPYGVVSVGRQFLTEQVTFAGLRWLPLARGQRHVRKCPDTPQGRSLGNTQKRRNR